MRSEVFHTIAELVLGAIAIIFNQTFFLKIFVGSILTISIIYRWSLRWLRMLFDNIFIKTYFLKYFENYGIQIGNDVHIVEGKFFSSVSKNFGLVRLTPLNYFLTVKGLVPRFEYKIEYCLIPIGHKLVHKVNDKEVPLEFLSITPFSVSEGVLELSKSVRKRMGFVSEVIKTGTNWPLN